MKYHQLYTELEGRSDCQTSLRIISELIYWTITRNNSHQLEVIVSVPDPNDEVHENILLHVLTKLDLMQFLDLYREM